MADRPPVLDLTTDVQPRATVRIDGVSYELRAERDLTLEQFNRVRTLTMQVADGLKARETGKMPEAAQQALHAQLGEAVRLALIDMPPAVMRKLDHVNRVAIFEAFLVRLPNLLPASVRTVLQEGGRSTGRKRSRGSSGSTAGRRPAGSGTRRSGSSGRA